jgi:hypothetical protein
VKTCGAKTPLPLIIARHADVIAMRVKVILFQKDLIIVVTIYIFIFKISRQSLPPQNSHLPQLLQLLGDAWLKMLECDRGANPSFTIVEEILLCKYIGATSHHKPQEYPLSSDTQVLIEKIVSVCLCTTIATRRPNLFPK